VRCNGRRPLRRKYQVPTPRGAKARRRAAIRAVSAYALAIAHPLARSTGSRYFFALSEIQDGSVRATRRSASTAPAKRPNCAPGRYLTTEPRIFPPSSTDRSTCVPRPGLSWLHICGCRGGEARRAWPGHRVRGQQAGEPRAESRTIVMEKLCAGERFRTISIIFTKRSRWAKMRPSFRGMNALRARPGIYVKHSWLKRQGTAPRCFVRAPLKQ
jgi:hypothetical protein